MSIYTMAQIVALTGIKGHTLRKWETRYSFLEPSRTDTNIRYYSDDQLKKLLNVGILVRAGVRISQIDKMSEEEIYKNVSLNSLNQNTDNEIDSLILSMLELNEIKFDNVVKSQIIKNGLLSTMTKIVYPFLNQVGILWGVNKVNPAQEHFITCLIKQKILSTIDNLPYPKENSPCILMFLPENEYHEIGLLLAYYIARELGWRVFYLGQNVPIQNIKQVINDVSPNAMLSMFVTPPTSKLKDSINSIISQGDIPLLVSGNPDLFKDVSLKNLIYLSNPEQLIEQLNILK